jgi:hypothetical protein
VSDESRNDTDWVTAYDGLPLQEVLDRAETEGRPTRVLRPGDAMTMDYRPDRLNIYLDDDGSLVEVRAG